MVIVRFEPIADVQSFHPRGIKAEGRRAIARPPARAGDWKRLHPDQRFSGLGEDKVHMNTVDRHPAVWQSRGSCLDVNFVRNAAIPLVIQTIPSRVTGQITGA